MQSADYFINNGDQTVDDGYWEPHTSSIDFCETNYLHSSYIAEPHNLFSSLWGLSLLGLIGIYYGNPTGEIRFKIAYGILILIGIGSAALHGTLNWVFQSADELPMIYLVISAMYCLIELGDDDDITVPIPSPSQQKYNNNNNSNNNNKVLKYPWLPRIFVVLGIINTLIYFRFQQIYIVFLLTFIVMIMAAFILHVQIAWRQRQIIILSLSTTFPNTDKDDETTTSNNSNNNRNNNNIRRNNAPHIFVVLGIINTLIYFRFQQIYIVFLLTFIVMIMAAFILHVQIAWRQRQIIILSLSTTFPNTDKDDETTTSNNSNNNRNNNNNMTVNIIRRNNAQIALRFYVWHYVVFVGIATPVWILDQFWCKNLLPIYNSLPYFLRGCTLHVIWHVMAGLGGYTILQFLVTCRMSVLGLPCKIQWILGIIPVVVSAVSSRCKENTKQL